MSSLLNTPDGVLYDERLADMMDEGQNSSRAWGIQLQVQASHPSPEKREPATLCGCNTAAYDFCNCGVGICAVCGHWSFHFQTYFCSTECRSKAELGKVA